MTEHLATASLNELYGTVKAFHDNGEGIPVMALPDLLKMILTAREWTKELEDDLSLARNGLSVATKMLRERQARHSADSNVIRLPAKPRVIATPPDGGDAA